jgi:hypothetical protein
VNTMVPASIRRSPHLVPEHPRGEQQAVQDDPGRRRVIHREPDLGSELSESGENRLLAFVVTTDKGCTESVIRDRLPAYRP